MYKKSIIIKLLLFSFLLSQNVEEKIQNDMLAYKLFNERKFQLAIIEFERLKLNTTNKERLKVYQEKIAQSYLNRGEKIEAINEYKKIINVDSSHFTSVFKVASIYQDLYYFYESNQFINEININFEGSQLDTLQFLKAINHFALNRSDSSLIILENNTSIVKLSEAKNIINDYNNKDKKNPKIASLLNTLFPGAGYFYLNLIQTGFATLFVESLFGYATVTSANNGYKFGSMFGGILFSGFYIGSIYGAKQQALKQKKMLLNQSVNDLKIFVN